MIDVAELSHRVRDAFAGRFRDERASAEDQGNRRFRDAGSARDVDNRRATVADLRLPTRPVVHYRHSKLARSNDMLWRNLRLPLNYWRNQGGCREIWNVLIVRNWF